MCSKALSMMQAMVHTVGPSGGYHPCYTIMVALNAGTCQLWGSLRPCQTSRPRWRVWCWMWRPSRQPSNKTRTRRCSSGQQALESRHDSRTFRRIHHAKHQGCVMTVLAVFVTATRPQWAALQEFCLTCRHAMCIPMWRVCAFFCGSLGSKKLCLGLFEVQLQAATWHGR